MVTTEARSLRRPARPGEEERARSRKAARQAMAASRPAAPELSAMVERTSAATRRNMRLSFITCHHDLSRRRPTGAPSMSILTPGTDRVRGEGPPSPSHGPVRYGWRRAGATSVPILTPAADKERVPGCGEPGAPHGSLPPAKSEGGESP